MNKYNGLLTRIANQYHIYRGNQESENNWKTRIVYSICGLMAYASLWDDSDDGISIIHLKRRIQKKLVDYQSMYPELSSTLPRNSKELVEEITNQFLNCGIIYHHPNRILPSMRREEMFNGLLFQRGISLDSISSVSGIGFYTKADGGKNPETIKSMFGLEQEDLSTLWYDILSSASWESKTSLESLPQFLRIKPPFYNGYWINEPNKSGTASILRIGTEGSRLYYLYRYNNSKLEISPLPNWRVEDYGYRTIACACLSMNGTLPPIEFFQDGSLIHLHLNYLIPPRELGFLKLYSWPEKFTKLPSDFNRKLQIGIFMALKKILEDEGYLFEEIKTNDKRSKFNT